jgi:hypothetical protein
MTIFDNPDTNPVLSAESVQQTFAEPASGAFESGDHFGYGWFARPVGTDNVNAWHYGTLFGTFAGMVRRFNGVSWVVLFNQRDDISDENYFEINSLFRHMDTITEWPEHDLFDAYL